MSKEELRIFLYVSLISADNDSLSEDVKQEIMRRQKKEPGNWCYILEPIEDEELRDRYIELLSGDEEDFGG